MAGEVRSVQQFGTRFEDGSENMAVDTAGNVYLAAATNYPSWREYYDVWLLKYRAR